MISSLLISGNDLRLFFSSRGNLIGLVVIPVLMTIVVGLFTGRQADSASKIITDVLDMDQSRTSAEFIEALGEADKLIAICTMETDAKVCGTDSSHLSYETALERLQDDLTTGVVVIPAGFEEAVLNQSTISIDLLTRERVSFQSALERALQIAIRQVNGASVAAVLSSEIIRIELGGVERLATPSELRKQAYIRAAQYWSLDPAGVLLESSSKGGGSMAGFDFQEGFGQSVPGMGSMFVMFTVLGGMTALIAERKQWTLQRLGTMPISKASLLRGKILGRFSLGMIQYLVVFVIGIAVGVNFGSDAIALILIMISYTLSITALSFAIGSRLDNEAQASGLSLLLSLILAPLGGAWWSLEIVPRFMQVLGHISPVAWAMDAFNSLIFKGGNLSTVWPSIAVLLGMTILFFIFGVRRFRYSEN